jgi:MFS family permease
MFVLSRHSGRLADRYGPRLFMGGGPLVAAAGLVLLQRVDASPDYLTDLLPGLVVFAVGLSLTVAPLTATVLADADEHNAGMASGVNNAIARVAGLVAIAGIGAMVASQYDTRFAEALGGAREQPAVRAAVDRMDARPFAVEEPEGLEPSATAAVVRAQEEASVDSFHFGIGIAVVLVGLGGVLGFAGIRNPRRQVAAEGCAGGQFVGVPEEASRQSPCDWHRELPAVTLPAREAAT